MRQRSRQKEGWRERQARTEEKMGRLVSYLCVCTVAGAGVANENGLGKLLEAYWAFAHGGPRVAPAPRAAAGDGGGGEAGMKKEERRRRRMTTRRNTRRGNRKTGRR